VKRVVSLLPEGLHLTKPIQLNFVRFRIFNPKGLRPRAQGCFGTSYPGNTLFRDQQPNGVESPQVAFGVNEPQPRWG